MKQFLRFFLLIVFVFGFFVPPVHALTFVTKEEGVASFEGKTSGSGFITGSTVRVEDEVNGDLYCAGRDVFVKTTVSGDVICAGQYVTIEGHVAGNVRVAGQHVTILGTVDKNVTAFAQKLSVSESASIGGELITGVQDLIVSGVVSKDMLVGSQTSHIDGAIGGDVRVYTEDLVVQPDASVAGSLVYAAKESTIAREVVMGGVAEEAMPVKEIEKVQRITPIRNWPQNRLPSILFHLGLGLLLVLLIPGRLKKVLTVMRDRPLQTLGVGILSFIVMPVFLILLVITLIGIPAALLVGMIFSFVLLVSRVFVAFLVGEQVLGAVYEKKKDQLMWQAGVGIIVAGLVFGLPVIGDILSLIALLWGTGGIFSTAYAGFRKRK